MKMIYIKSARCTSQSYAMLAKYEDIMQNGKKSERDNIIIEEKIKHDKLVHQ